MMKKIIILLFVNLFSLAMYSQYEFITIDADGYTNVRKEPSAKAEILGTVNKYQTFISPNESCYMTGKILEHPNWQSIVVAEVPIFQVGYIYKKHLRCLADLEKLSMVIVDSLHCYFADDNMRLEIAFSPFEDQNRIGATLSNITYSYQEKEGVIAKEDVPISFHIGDLYTAKEGYEISPYQIFKTEDDIYFLEMQGGDGGDSCVVQWVFDKGKLMATEWAIGHCTLLPLTLHPVVSENH